ncbi:hypothetical protein M011DRAFT_309945 [Sporormia fimetaria CBS 119925]|uniref:Zn(2)-C6 fungal-type domain-containing protein n=1 Tax=Sporormia fimetaria CBS 119925 TaxID=1340428 RepID=A0A6A6VFV8_9PLEO|nr:hypothetical protein M011DRAFT_309945 [Sporormia fimetaria CBS 119925]
MRQPSKRCQRCRAQHATCPRDSDNQNTPCQRCKPPNKQCILTSTKPSCQHCLDADETCIWPNNVNGEPCQQCEADGTDCEIFIQEPKSEEEEDFREPSTSSSDSVDTDSAQAPTSSGRRRHWKARPNRLPELLSQQTLLQAAIPPRPEVYPASRQPFSIPRGQPFVPPTAPASTSPHQAGSQDAAMIPDDYVPNTPYVLQGPNEVVLTPQGYGSVPLHPGQAMPTFEAISPASEASASFHPEQSMPTIEATSQGLPASGPLNQRGVFRGLAPPACHTNLLFRSRRPVV